MNPVGLRSGGRPRLALVLPLPPEWVADALCAQTDPDAFFPEKGGSTAAAKRTCVQCPVRERCLAYAMEHGERYGIWGGLSDRERRRLRRNQQGREAA